jgi:hypothetical protein
MMTRTLDTIREEASAALRAATRGPDALRPERLRHAADLLVEARAHFYTGDGSPDWTGRSYAYRQFTSEVYAHAGVSASDLHTLQASVRYHVSNALRARLTDEELESIGLRVESARDRSVAKRSRQSKTLSMVAGGAPIDTPAEAVHALQVAAGILRRVAGGPLAEAPVAERRRVAGAVREVADEVSRLARVTK